MVVLEGTDGRSRADEVEESCLAQARAGFGPKPCHENLRMEDMAG